MNQTHRTSAFAGQNERVVIRLLWTPAESAVDLLLFRPKKLKFIPYWKSTAVLTVKASFNS
jgi:hypothetical protein